MIGDRSDVRLRLKAVLPWAWFGDNTPVLDSLLDCLSTAWASIYSFISYVKSQARLGTATELWLDMAANDFFGSRFSRRTAESDSAFRTRLLLELVRERCTRAAVCRAVSDVTGRQPTIFEPAHCGDTGSYASASSQVKVASGGLAYGVVGGWGNLDLPFQSFITVFRPQGTGIATLPGWRDPQSGYCSGSTSYATSAMGQGGVSDEDIRETILSVLPTATIAWVQIADRSVLME